MKCSTSNYESKPLSNKKNDSISQTPSRNIKNKVKAQPMNVNKKNRVVESIRNVVQIVLSYLDSGCSKHMTGKCSQLINFVSKFLGTVRFRNDHIAWIMGYGDYQMGNVTILRVYYVEGLRHNLYSIGQFCDADLEVAFQKNTCFICNLEGVYLIYGSRDTNLYTVSLDDMLKTSLICLLSKALRLRASYGTVSYHISTLESVQNLQQKNLEIIEAIHVTFDELTAMASEQFSLGPGLHSMTPATSSSGLVPNFVSQQPFTATPRAIDLADSYVSTSIDQDAPSASAVDPTLFTQKAGNDLLLVVHDKEFNKGTINSDHEDVNEHINKVLEIVDLFHIPNITQDQVMLRSFPMSLTGAKKEEINNFQQEPDETLYQACDRFKELLMKCPRHYLTKMQEVILFYNGLEVPSRQILDSKAIYTQLNNLGREIKKVNEKVYVAQVECEQFKGPYYTKDCPLKEEGKTLKEAYYTQFGGPFQGGGYRAAALRFYQRNNVNPSYQERRQSMEETLSKFMRASVSVMPLSTYLNLGLGELAHTKLTVELADTTGKYPKGIAENVLVGIGIFVFLVDFIILDMPEDFKVPLILRRPFLSMAYAKMDVFKKKITLRVGDEKIIFTKARLVGETLVLNRSLNPLYGDYIELNDLNEPLELRRHQVDDLMPTIEECAVIDEPMIDIIKTMNNESFDE
nr:integrase, catalytic region, zinc finger, CCHC-type, peptidase aspartic, catalytic [Tanacetum cinerariifolium]